MEASIDQAERQTVALETAAKNTDTLVLIAQLWSLAAVLGGIVWLIFIVKGG